MADESKIAAPMPPRLAASINDVVCVTPSLTIEARRTPPLQRPSTPTTASEPTIDHTPPGEWKEVVSKEKRKRSRHRLLRKNSHLHSRGLPHQSSRGRYSGFKHQQPQLQCQLLDRCLHRNRKTRRSSCSTAVTSHTCYMKGMTWTK